MHAECNIHFIEIGNDKQILGVWLRMLPCEIEWKIHHGQHNIARLEYSLHRGMGMRHCFYRHAHHNLTHLCDINAIQVIIDRKLHDFNFVGSRFQ